MQVNYHATTMLQQIEMSYANELICADFGRLLNGQLAAISGQLHVDPAGDGDVHCCCQC
jgi:hypothetical protein